LKGRFSPLLFDLLVVGLLGGVVVSAAQWPFETSLFPLVIGVPIFALALAQLGKDALAMRSDPSQEGTPVLESIPDVSTDRSVPTHLVFRRAGGFYASAIGLYLLILMVGFHVAVPLFPHSLPEILRQGELDPGPCPDLRYPGSNVRGFRSASACPLARTSDQVTPNPNRQLAKISLIHHTHILFLDNVFEVLDLFFFELSEGFGLIAQHVGFIPSDLKLQAFCLLESRLVHSQTA